MRLGRNTDSQREGKEETKREYKNREGRDVLLSVFLNMSKAPGLIRLSHGATGGICSV